MDKKFKRYKVDYAAAYRHYIDFGGGRILEKFCQDEGLSAFYNQQTIMGYIAGVANIQHNEVIDGSYVPFFFKNEVKIENFGNF